MSIQGRTWESNVFLSLSGVPVTGILPAGVTAKYRRAGDTALQTKALTASDWVEIGNGLYVIKWTTSEMRAVGPFLFQLSGGSSFDSFYDGFDVLPYPVGSVITPTKCIVTGNVMDLGGTPDQDMQIKFRIAKYPASFQGAIAGGKPIFTTPDPLGAFSVSLLRGAIVIVTMEGAGLKQQFVVPDQDSAALLDLLPPINNNPP